jgi:hypothetical protein
MVDISSYSASIVNGVKPNQLKVRGHHLALSIMEFVVLFRSNQVESNQEVLSLHSLNPNKFK